MNNRLNGTPYHRIIKAKDHIKIRLATMKNFCWIAPSVLICYCNPMKRRGVRVMNNKMRKSILKTKLITNFKGYITINTSQ
jgi:hypothetical protein